jgi:uncharacterized protein with HEPN domain
VNRDRVYLLHMLACIEKIEAYAMVGKDEFFAKSHWQDAIIRNLEILGEASKQLSSSFKAQHPEIPWRRVAGLRDVLIHDYFGVDLNSVWQVVEQNVPILKKSIQSGLVLLDEQ